ncbi:hypothetical protein AJ80_02079 [Polytolypa hystricis UAMH7299]|uniref:tripeptidyl-peptidase II n=1 Tax=Polytolypa hystricis (strain UAMH7299) TaxID=1447883 RepID=A0A2B7YS02_POLH7|nr:hypothetical protein AJ80_02079 [Polytolypa hystricis UAMH7299]
MSRFLIRFLQACALLIPILGALAAPVVYETLERLPSAPPGWVQAEPPSPDTIIRFRLAVWQEKADLFEQMVLDISTPGHSKYGLHMKRDEVKAFLKPASHVSDAILSWLESEGVSRSSVEDDGDWIGFAITVSQAEKLMRTRFYYFENEAGKGRVIRTLQYSAPREVAPYVHMVQPTTKFPQIEAQDNMLFQMEVMEAAQTFNAPNLDCDRKVTPDCLRTLYKIGDFTAKPDPRNKVGISGYLEQYARYGDFARFLEIFAPRLKNTTFDVELINGGQNLQESGEDSVEASLDIDYAISLSNATSVYYSTGGRGPLVPDVEQPGKSRNQNEPYLEQLQYFLRLPDRKLPAVLTTSYGETEQSVPKRYSDVVCAMFAQLGVRGVSVIFASGDSGPGTACLTNDGKNTTRFSPIFPAACPYVTSVGATFNTNPERAIEFSSGGFSDRYSRPLYQRRAVDEYLRKHGKQWKGYYNPHGRGFPDVAAQGRNFAVIDKARQLAVSGTSASAPVFAAIIANLNSIRLARGKPVLGLLNPFLYGIGQSGFTDIVDGGSIGCEGTTRTGLPGGYIPNAGWNATKGWDPVTGLGTPNFEKLAQIVKWI